MSITNLNAGEFRPAKTVQVRLAGEILTVTEFSWNQLTDAVETIKPVIEQVNAGTPFMVAALGATKALTEVMAMALDKDTSFFNNVNQDEAAELLALIWVLNKEKLGNVLPGLLMAMAGKHPVVAAIAQQLKKQSASTKPQRNSSRRAR